MTSICWLRPCCLAHTFDKMQTVLNKQAKAVSGARQGRKAVTVRAQAVQAPPKLNTKRSEEVGTASIGLRSS